MLAKDWGKFDEYGYSKITELHEYEYSKVEKPHEY